MVLGAMQITMGRFANDTHAYLYEIPLPLVLAFHLVLGRFHIYEDHLELVFAFCLTFPSLPFPSLPFIYI